MHTPPDTLGIALDARAKGLVAIPCHPGTKIPVVKWKPWQTEMPPVELQERWFRDTRVNIAILTTGLVIFDCDDPAKADLVLEECGDTPHRLKTPRGGIHLGYRRRKGVEVGNRVRIKGLPIDIRTDGGLELIPNSVTDRGAYTWLQSGLRPIAELPVAHIGWTRERAKGRLTVVVADASPGAMARRAQAYVAKIEPAVSGQGGHNRTFRVACALVQKFGLTAEKAWPILVEYSERCRPPWSERELRHKLDDALKKSPRR